MAITISTGQFVKIPCGIQPGPFSNERLITIEADNQTFSGFVNIEHLTETSPTQGFVTAKVIDRKLQSVTVQIPASFFNMASGTTSVSSGWVERNWKVGAIG